MNEVVMTLDHPGRLAGRRPLEDLDVLNHRVVVAQLTTADHARMNDLAQLPSPWPVARNRLPPPYSSDPLAVGV